MRSNYQIKPTRQNHRHSVSQFLRKFKINRTDLLFIALCAVVSVYMVVKEPVLMSVLGCSSVMFFGLWQITRTVPILEKLIGAKIRFWHVVTAIIAVTALLNTFEMPAHAIFLSGLEAFFKQIATQSSTAGGGTAIDETTIGLIFNVIRGVFLLLVAAASLFAYNQAQQGNDWRPIVTQIGLAFGIVIAIDVITFLFIGNGTATAINTFFIRNIATILLN
ncbi:hypothetical protein H6G81_04530 [Scytonema hofmannii FACHB-248]|uniref:Uncharacterized protein n=1 Tax=Scytonema hofmannii FACHB-248 TaxID=1842502 RepID=A0ABR8GKS5_9CYAN|nr:MULTISPECIES: hypothetical protein [Nostocales]MBD2603816.1 hypothetical protein [Scytonema hofmannii FACHB-248]